jgi:hypothetical protein
MFTLTFSLFSLNYPPITYIFSSDAYDSLEILDGSAAVTTLPSVVPAAMYYRITKQAATPFHIFIYYTNHTRTKQAAMPFNIPVFIHYHLTHRHSKSRSTFYKQQQVAHCTSSRLLLNVII